MARLSKEAKAEREAKEKAEIVLRSDEAYLEIEAFKAYEFSWCIAFEMAKRNPTLLQDAKRFIRFYQNHKRRIAYIPHDHHTFEKAFAYRVHRRAKEVFAIGYEYFAQVHWLDPIDLYYITDDPTALEMAELYVEQFCTITPQRPNERFELVDDEGVMVTSSVAFHNDHFFQNTDVVNDEAIVTGIENYEIDPSAIESHRRVSEQFARPKLKIPAMYDKSVALEINLVLPKEELIAYLSLIKEHYDQREGFVKSPMQLLDAEISMADFTAVDAKEVYRKDRRKSLSEKFADLFFIYDCYTNNLSKEYTIDRLNRYWNEERKAFPDKFQSKTYQRYLRFAKTYIEEKKYQSLLVGK